MNIFVEAYRYGLENFDKFRQELLNHIELVAITMAIAMLICIPLGIWTSRSRAVSLVAINTFNVLRVIPSLAILFIFITVPGFGMGTRSVLFALTVLALPPILINTDAGFRNIDAAVREAARGMGMSARQILWRVEFPLALPVLLTGLRIALVEVIASATLAAFIGGQGLGQFIILGFSLNKNDILLVGAIPVALLALCAEFGMGWIQRWVQPPTH